MLLIACVDDNSGMMFGSRRQSMDRAVRAHMLAVCEGRTLWMSPYSAAQFEDGARICADEDYAHKVQTGDACFAEDGTLPMLTPSAVLLYRWNRRYPADRFFPFDPLDEGYRLVSSEKLVGSSHERITADYYEKETTV